MERFREANDCVEQKRKAEYDTNVICSKDKGGVFI